MAPPDRWSSRAEGAEAGGRVAARAQARGQGRDLPVSVQKRAILLDARPANRASWARLGCTPGQSIFFTYSRLKTLLRPGPWPWLPGAQLRPCCDGCMLLALPDDNMHACAAANRNRVPPSRYSEPLELAWRREESNIL